MVESESYPCVGVIIAVVVVVVCGVVEVFVWIVVDEQRSLCHCLRVKVHLRNCDATAITGTTLCWWVSVWCICAHALM